jgi:hypothetical protein
MFAMDAATDDVSVSGHYRALFTPGGYVPPTLFVICEFARLTGHCSAPPVSNNGGPPSPTDAPAAPSCVTMRSGSTGWCRSNVSVLSLSLLSVCVSVAPLQARECSLLLAGKLRPSNPLPAVPGGLRSSVGAGEPPAVVAAAPAERASTGGSNMDRGSTGGEGGMKPSLHGKQHKPPAALVSELKSSLAKVSIVWRVNIDIFMLRSS